MDEFDEFETAPPAELLEPTPHKLPDGTPLAAYSFARRLVYRSFFEQEADPADQMFTLALLFTLALPEAEAKALLFDRRGGRAKLLEWIERTVKTQADYPPLRELANLIVTETDKGRVDQVPPSPATPQKKT